MDAALQLALTGAVSDFADVATDQLTAILPVALPVLAGVAGVFFAIKIVRGILHM